VRFERIHEDKLKEYNMLEVSLTAIAKLINFEKGKSGYRATE